MPCLKIKYPTKKYLQLLYGVAPVMLYPNDHERQKEFRDVTFYKAHIQAMKETLGIQKQVPNRFINYKPHKQIINDQNIRVFEGVIAGQILCNLYFMKIHSKPVSLENSFELTEASIRDEYSSQKDYKSVLDNKQRTRKYVSIVSNGRNIEKGVSRRKLQDYWKEYKSVSHLWASTLIWNSLASIPFSQKNWLSIKGIGEVLSISEHLRNFGETTTIGKHNTTTYIFDINTTWHPPVHCKLYELNLRTLCESTVINAYFLKQYGETYENAPG
ncbi:MAG: hypothetical protein AB9872_10300 [Solidesulfovibrio sp.]